MHAYLFLLHYMNKSLVANVLRAPNSPNGDVVTRGAALDRAPTLGEGSRDTTETLEGEPAVALRPPGWKQGSSFSSRGAAVLHLPSPERGTL